MRYPLRKSTRTGVLDLRKIFSLAVGHRTRGPAMVNVSEVPSDETELGVLSYADFAYADDNLQRTPYPPKTPAKNESTLFTQVRA